MLAHHARVRRGTGGLDPDMEQRILELAVRDSGRVTITAVAHELSVPLRTADAALTALTKAGYVAVETHPASGAVIYVFPEIDAGLVPMMTRAGSYVPRGDPLPILPAQHAAPTGTPFGLVRVSNKSKLTAALLAICGGAFGAHKFYLGHGLWGVLYLSTFWTFVPAIAGLFEGVRYLVMSDHAFDLKHNARLV
jgi:TM2 domain-containing membrane protein YozV